MKGLFDLGIAWEWEYDFDFVNLIVQKCEERNLTVFHISVENFEDLFKAIQKGDVNFFAYFDRASDIDEGFAKLNLLLNSRGVYVINRYNEMLRASDKATMHLELLNAGVNLPFTVILPPFDDEPNYEIDRSIFDRVGVPFIIKPSSETGGGTGVKIGNSIEDITEARKEFPYDKYLIQEIIRPLYIGEDKAWFRAFYILDEILICWWDSEMKVYRSVKEEEILKYGLCEIKDIMRKIKNVCKLDFFSSEITLSISNGVKKFIAIDYVNEVPDMRLKSKAFDGVPDEVVQKIAQRIADFVASLK
jgi:hypothetical protein